MAREFHTNRCFLNAGLAVFLILLSACVERAAKEPPAASEMLLGKDILHLRVHGKVSHFGGPADPGVKTDEGLALVRRVEDLPEYFLPVQPPGTTGLARRLNPWKFYVALRWDYKKTPKPVLLRSQVLVVNPETGDFAWARPVDWGPHERTGRVADLSYGLAGRLGLKTDDRAVIHVFVPKTGGAVPLARKPGTP